MTRIITIITLISLTLFSCEKANEKEMQNDLQHQQSSIQSEMSDLEIRINNFLEDIENEEEGSLSLDSTVYFLEAGFNYRYANSGRDEELVATQLDTSYVEIQVNSEGMCSFSNMKESFDDIYLVMDNIFDNISFEDKALNILDISSQQTETGVQLRLISFWKFGSFTMSGDWIWGQNGGKCDGTFQGLLDATDAIERRYELTSSTLLPYGIWHNINMTPFYYADKPLMTQNAPSNPFGYFDSWLFYYYKDPSSSVCLLHDEIDFYVDNIPEVIDRIKNDANINLTIKGIDIEYDFTVYNNIYTILHTARLIYGRYEEKRIVPGYDDFISI